MVKTAYYLNDLIVFVRLKLCLFGQLQILKVKETRRNSNVRGLERTETVA